ncbi:trypsin-like serine peptidase [Neolewinella litorea]|uniref:Serine protease n=1 Tax=Neolewinella litorea TaxID=2562452 RepID=A0A4S4NUX1_9BACT|nr:serine protease [Neolewinella litorea]THH40040.1 serine protease [Neolewinella litorea]
METKTQKFSNGHSVVSSDSGDQGGDEFGGSYSEFGESNGSMDESTDTLESLGLEQLQESGGASPGFQPQQQPQQQQDDPDESYGTLEEFHDEAGDEDEGQDDYGGEGMMDDMPGGGGGGISIVGDQPKIEEAYAATYPDETTVMEVVIGRDDRRRVPSTRNFPYRAIVQLVIEAKNGRRYVGTGWLISPRTVITAGHCVYLHNAGGWPKSIQVSPGMNGNSKPFGTCRATAFRSVKGWVSGKQRDYDYGAIILPRSHPFGKRTGTFRYASYSNRTLLQKYVNICGYPGDKGGKHQYYHARRIARLTDKRLSYLIDTAGGQSGSPIFFRRGNNRIAVGIHTTGSMSGNGGTRINASVKSNLMRWAREGA